jgi:tight adherence protein B
MINFDPVTIAMFAAAAVGLVTILFFATFVMESDRRRLQNRVTRIHQRQVLKSEVPSTAVGSLRVGANGRMKGLEALAGRLLPRPALLRERLQKTGRNISLGQYAAACVAVGLAASLARVFLLDLSPMLAILFGVAAGVGLPHMAISFLVARRIKAFTANFPDAIDLIIRGLRSGLPVPESIRVVGQEFEGPVGVEFTFVSDRVKLGQSLDEALWDAAKRIDIPDFKFFVISLSVQRETGGNLAETLENLSDILRKRRQMLLKIKAMSSEAKASALILGSLPFIMFGIMFVLNNGYVMQLLTDPRGVVAVTAAVGWLLLGIAAMAKMVRFEI